MNKLDIKNMDFHIDLNYRIISIIGPSNSGKTYMLKKLVNIIDNHDVFIDNQCISGYDISYLKKNICVVLNNDSFETDNVKEELVYYLNILNIDEKEISKRYKEVSSAFKLNNILDYKLEDLSLEDKTLIKILSFLIIKPAILGIDNILCYLNSVQKSRVLKYARENNINIIFTTTDSNELKCADYVYVVNELKCVHHDKYTNIVKGNSILPYLGIKLPFAAELSQNLMLYDLIKDVELDERKLVNSIWK